jgi:hypothetical protein
MKGGIASRLAVARLACAHVLRRGALPLTLAAAAAFVALGTALPLPRSGEAAAVPALLVLHLPALLVTAAGLASAIEAWPPFCRGAAGVDLLLRVAPGRTEGCAAAAAGACAALAALLLAAGALFAGAAVARGVELPRAQRYLGLVAPRDAAWLTARSRELRATTGTTALLDAVRLNPLAFVRPGSGEVRAVELQVRLDGEPAGARPWLPVAGSHEDLLVEFEPRPAREVELALRAGEDGGLHLFFPDGAIEVREAASSSGFASCVLAASSYTVPAALALALACALRGRVRRSIAVGAALGVLVLATILDLTPNARAVSLFAHGRLPLLPSLGPAVAALAACAALAAVPRRRGARGRGGLRCRPR